MIKIAEMLPPTPSALWKLAAQAGVTHAVGGLPFNDASNGAEQPWDYLPLLRTKQKYVDNGFTLDVIESRPPMELAKRGLPGGEAEIDSVCTLVENMGRLGVPVYCYEWMCSQNWMRTSTTTPSRGGSVVTSYDHSLMKDAPIVPLGPISEEKLWETLQHFLLRVLPVAERAGVKLSMHPDDPPLSPIRGVGRIMRSVDNYQRLLDLADSPMNTITLCQGNFALMTNELPKAIRKFDKKISFVHFRDVRGTAEKFEETWHDDGQTDMLETLRAYRDIGYEGVLRPDHVPTVEGDSNSNAGYSSFGRLFAIGYIKGLREAVYREGK